jgi:hypothetical protein
MGNLEQGVRNWLGVKLMEILKIEVPHIAKKSYEGI